MRVVGNCRSHLDRVLRPQAAGRLLLEHIMGIDWAHAPAIDDILAQATTTEFMQAEHE